VGAHARLTGSAPAAGDVLDGPPTDVRLFLSAKPATLEGDPMQLYGPEGERLATGEATVAAGGSTVTVMVDGGQDLPAGDWSLVYRIVSADTHVISGRLTFTVLVGVDAAEAADDATTAPPPPGADTVGSAPLGLHRVGDAWTPSAHDVTGPGERLGDGARDVRPLAAAAGAVVVALLAAVWQFGRRERAADEVVAADGEGRAGAGAGAAGSGSASRSSPRPARRTDRARRRLDPTDRPRRARAPVPSSAAGGRASAGAAAASARRPGAPDRPVTAPVWPPTTAGTPAALGVWPSVPGPDAREGPARRHGRRPGGTDGAATPPPGPRWRDDRGTRSGARR
jgi:methionine-rich copper-binding protein CopC